MMESKFGRRGLIAGIASGVAFVVGGCASMLGRQRRAQNDRFEEFSEYVPKKLDVRTDLEQLEKWMPGAHLSKAHWVMQYRQKKREMLPSPDRPLWVNAVLVLDSETTKALAAVSTGKSIVFLGSIPICGSTSPRVTCSLRSQRRRSMTSSTSTTWFKTIRILRMLTGSGRIKWLSAPNRTSWYSLRRSITCDLKLRCRRPSHARVMAAGVTMSLSGFDRGGEACSRSWPTSASVWVAVASGDAVNELR